MTQMLYYLLCVVTVVIDGKLNTCPQYRDPKNGRMICDQLLGKYCSPECHNGFEPSPDAAWAYICNLNTKKWMTYPENYTIPWPDCIAESSRTSRTSGNRSHAETNENMLKNLDVVSSFISNVMDKASKGSNMSENDNGSNERRLLAAKEFNIPNSYAHYSTTNGVSSHVSENLKYNDDDIKKDHYIISQGTGKHGEHSGVRCDSNEANESNENGNISKNEANNCIINSKTLKPGEARSDANADVKEIRKLVATPKTSSERYNSTHSTRREKEAENNSSIYKNTTMNNDSYNPYKIVSSVEENEADVNHVTNNHDSTKSQRKLTPADHELQSLRRHNIEERFPDAYGSGDKEGPEKKQKTEANVTVKASVNKPLVPVFSVEDLALLRHIVSNFIIKRSDLLHSSSSLWSKMVQLTSNRNSPFLGKRKMLSRKLLANKDTDVARLIMNDINRANAYKLQHKSHPVKFAKLLKHSRTKFENPYSRQYVFNGATFVPVPEIGPAPSYLNSDKGGGLSPGSKYRWNGATFVPVSPEDLPIISEETEIKPDSQPDDKVNNNAMGLQDEKVADQSYNSFPTFPGLEPDLKSRYVFNGATFVPLPEGMGKDISYLNTEGGGGLTPESKYRWNGATFVTTANDVDDNTADQLEGYSVNNEIQRILDMWNNQEHKQKDSERPNKAAEIQSYDANELNNESDQKRLTTPQPPPTYNPFLPTDAIESSGPTVSSSSDKRSDNLYYWDGVEYALVTSVRKLPVGTMRYKKVNGNFEQVDIVNELTNRDVKEVNNVPDYQAQLLTMRQQQEQQGNQQKLKQQQQAQVLPIVFTTSPTSPNVQESSVINSGVETRPKYIWNGATFVPAQDMSVENKNLLADKTPPLYEWTGDRFLPTLDTGTKILYTWNGASFVPYLKSIYTPQAPVYLATPTQVKSSGGQLLGPLYPTRNSVYETQDKSNAPNQDASGINLFDAKINYPNVPSNDQEVDLIETAKADNGILTTPRTTTTTTATTTTTTATTTTVLIPPRNPYLPTSKEGDEGPDEKSKFNDQLSDKPDDSILLPPPNPYLPTDKVTDSTDEIAKLEDRQDTSSSISLPRPNLYLPGVKNETSEVEEHRVHFPTPMMHTKSPYAKVESLLEDEENLEGVIKHDPDLKNEIEDLTRRYDESPPNTPISLPSSQAFNDKKLLKSAVFDMATSIDKVLDDDLKQKAPEESNAQRDIDAADHLLQREEEKQNYYGPTAQVKGAIEDDEATKQLKAALDKIEEKKKETTRVTSVSAIDALSTSEKGKLEKTLQEDMDKLSSSSLGKSQSESELESYRESGLNVQDLRELLEITRMAEKQATAKKFGLTRPNFAHLRAMKVLKKKSVRSFLRYLIKRHALTKALTRLNLKDFPKENKTPIISSHVSSYHKKKEEKYHNTVRKLVTEWNKSYKDITRKQYSALPKFHG